LPLAQVAKGTGTSTSGGELPLPRLLLSTPASRALTLLIVVTMIEDEEPRCETMEAPQKTVKAYTVLLRMVIVRLRFRLRMGEDVSADEVHDLMDAIENIPLMLMNYGGWHVEANIDAALERYDQRWLPRGNSAHRDSLVEMLARAKRGELDE
jgi:hypothetical protein